MILFHEKYVQLYFLNKFSLYKKNIQNASKITEKYVPKNIRKVLSQRVLQSYWLDCTLYLFNARAWVIKYQMIYFLSIRV